jgi:hypothetical protein
VSIIGIKHGDTIEPGLRTQNGALVSVAMYVRTRQLLKGRYEPLFLCADQADQLALELIRLAAQLRKFGREGAEETEEAPAEVVA